MVAFLLGVRSDGDRESTTGTKVREFGTGRNTFKLYINIYYLEVKYQNITTAETLILRVGYNGRNVKCVTRNLY